MVYESCYFGAEVEIVGDTEKLRGYQKKAGEAEGGVQISS